ncbi:DUF6125 family protein [Chloroflexota bacterium]
MNKEKLRQLPSETLASLLEVCLNDLRVCDGWWYLGVENRYGTEVTTAIDQQVWEKLAKAEAEALKKSLNLNVGMEGLVKALELSPSWIIMGDYEVEQLSHDMGILRVVSCSSQQARLRMGRELFPCRAVGEAMLIAFAQAIDQRIRTSCIFSPPERNYSPWCEWQFHLEQ